MKLRAGNGVAATPTVFINGRVLTGALQYAAYESVVDDELRKKELK